MTLKASLPTNAPRVVDTGRGPLATRWIRRSTAVFLLYVTVLIVGPWLFDAPAPVRAFGAGMVVPGAGLLYAIPSTQQSFGTGIVTGHAVLIAIEIVVVVGVLTSRRWVAAVAGVVSVAVLGWACAGAPAEVVIAGHLAGFFGVLTACAWALAIRWIGRADSFTLASIVVVSAAVGAGLTALHDDMIGHEGMQMHAKMAMPMTWIPWAAMAVAIGGVLTAIGYATARDISVRRTGSERRTHLGALSDEQHRSIARTAPVDLAPTSANEPAVSEASTEELQLMRYLVSVAAQPTDSWSSFDDEAAGPLQQYRYQVNALGWALAMYQYSHAPAYDGALTSAQVALIERAQHKAVWGYWYWQNLLGNWDFIKRRADPVGNPQNIMFTGYLNLQLAMFRQATGDARFDATDAIAFNWSPRQRYAYSHQQLNAIATGNFDQDLYLWPCEPVVSRGRKRGFVFPYCNAVTTAGIAIMDTINNTTHANVIAPSVQAMIQKEFTLPSEDLVAFMISGLGLRVRGVMVGTSVTATIAAFLAPLCPDLAWRTWETLKREWLESGQYRVPASSGAELPDWATNAKTNAAPLAGAMLLASSCGETSWHDELWRTAVEQLNFDTDSTGVGRFVDASVYGNGMLGFGGFARPLGFHDMLTRVRPKAWNVGPRLRDAPHPAVLVSKAVTDGHGLDVVVNPGGSGARVLLEFDRLRPGHRYLVHGGVDAEVIADHSGVARAAVDVHGRTSVLIRPS